MKNNITDLSKSIASAIEPYRKITERVVGFVPFVLECSQVKYQGTSRKPDRIGVLEKTLTKLVGAGVKSKENLAKYVGIDLKDDIDKELFLEAINNLKNRHQFVKGDNFLDLTTQGNKYLSDGFIINTFTKEYFVVLDLRYPNFYYLSEYFKPNPKKGVKGKFANLDFEVLKKLTEVQASHMENEESRIELTEASELSSFKYSVEVIVCFLQSVRDNSVRTLIYDEANDCILPRLSDLFDNNKDLCDSLLNSCLQSEVKAGDAEVVDSGEKTETQVVVEQKLIEIEDSENEDNNENQPQKSDNKIGSIYDSLQFEKELHEIFSNHSNEEIWLISPWIRKFAFLRAREPMIRQFLEKGGSIFIGYSESERAGEEMVDRESMSVIKILDANYDRFYYAQMPKFHTKNVIEYKKGVATLYSGSFNVLSFSIGENTKHFRMEEMMVSNPEAALTNRKKYLRFFTTKYVEGIIDGHEENKPITVPKLSYLREQQEVSDIFETLENSETSQISYSYTEDQLIKLADTIINDKYSLDENLQHAQLVALLYSFEYAKRHDDLLRLEKTKRFLDIYLQRISIYKIFRITFTKWKEDETKSQLRIVYNGVNYEFNGVTFDKRLFTILQKHKEVINFKEESIRYAIGNLDTLLSGVANICGYRF